jgi:hypothetical protein
MRTKFFVSLEILEKIGAVGLQFCSGNDNGKEVTADLFTGSVAGNVAGFTQSAKATRTCLYRKRSLYYY